MMDLVILNGIIFKSYWKIIMFLKLTLMTSHTSKIEWFEYKIIIKNKLSIWIPLSIFIQLIYKTT